MSDVNLNKYPSCLSWQVLDKNRRTADRTCGMFYWPLQHYETMSFLYILLHIFHIIMVKEEKGK